MRATRELTAAEYDASRCQRFRSAHHEALAEPTPQSVWIGIDMAPPRCDCPGCAPRSNVQKAHTSPVAQAIRFAGLNTPDSKRIGAAQTLAPP